MSTGASAAGDAAWAELVRVAMLGTTRAGGAVPNVMPNSVPPALAPLLGALAADRVGGAERALLDHAAVLSTYRRAGQLPARAPGPAPDPAPLDAEDLPACPPAVAGLLGTMLGGEFRGVLPEWMARVQARGWRVPAAALPATLDLATATPALRPAVAGVLGARGRWLAARNPDWAWAAPPSSPEALRAAWDAGTPAERDDALVRLRAADPAGARALLVAAWSAEGAATRARLLGALAARLGPDDEPFLEQALDDRSREVRLAAAGLLAALPGSRLVTRMTERARGLLRHRAGGLFTAERLDVVLPDVPDAAAVRDGVQVTTPSRLGTRASCLVQILAAVPPATWTAAFGVDADGLVDLASVSEWSAPLTEGWARAAIRYADAEWAEALLRGPLVIESYAQLARTRADLLALLPPERRTRLLGDVLAGRVAVMDIDGLLAGAPGPWDEALGRTALAWVRARVTHPRSTPTVTLPALALTLPPALADEAATGWPSELAPAVARAVEQFVAALEFRATLNHAMRASGRGEPGSER